MRGTTPGNMRGNITAEEVAWLGRAAGFELAAERCKLLAPQLEWLLGEAENLASLDLSRAEPLCVFRPPTVQSEALNGQASERQQDKAGV